MNNEKTRYLYAILKEGGKWGVVTSTKPLNASCIQLTPVLGYPVTVTYRAIENGVEGMHQIVCENSNMLGTLLNEMGKLPESHLLESIWNYNVHAWQYSINEKNPHPGDYFLRRYGILKAYLDKDERGLWVAKLGKTAPAGSLLLSVIDKFPVHIVYSSSDLNGSSNYRDIICETEEEFTNDLNELFQNCIEFYVHTFAEYKENTPVSQEVYRRLYENLTDGAAEEMQTQSSFARYVFAKESLIDHAVNQLIEVLTKTDIKSDFEGSLTEDVAETVGSILAEKGIAYCHPFYLNDSIPCYATDVCENANCPFRRKN